MEAVFSNCHCCWFITTVAGDFTGDTTEQAGASTVSDSDFKTASDGEAATDKEVETLSLQPLEKATDNVVSSTPPPSPTVDTDQTSISVLPTDLPADSDLKMEDELQVSTSDTSDGYTTCEDQQSTVEVLSDLFHHAKHDMSAASKYRLRCQCGAKNCRQYLY